MGKFNKEELAICFFNEGKECIKSADTLYHDRKRGAQSKYEILLTHGIELLLKSFLLLKNNSLPDNAKEIDLYLKGLGHSLKKIYKECQKHGFSFTEPFTPHAVALEAYLDSMTNTFYGDSITARYTQETKMLTFDPVIFAAITGHLIQPLHLHFFPDSHFPNDYGY